MKKLITLLSTMLLLVTSVVNAKGYTETKYPIVLVHGILGVDDVLGIDYFYRVPRELSRSGAQVYVAAVSAANSSELRGEQLLQQVEYVLALTGAEKVNLFGHSQGSQTVRYVASVAPDLVASVTSIGGVNFGSPVADIYLETLNPNTPVGGFAARVGDALATMISFFSGHPELPQDAVAGVTAITTAGSLAFNEEFPEGLPNQYCGQGPLRAENGVYYFSWGGADPNTNFFDPLDAITAVTRFAFDEANDGLVASCSTHLGYVIRDNYRMNHFDEVNHSFGIHHLFETDPLTLYRQQANRLKNMGF